MTIRFDGRVAIVTGAGNGLGRAHALGLASRGAKVVVNDFGGARDGTGGSLSPAEAVVEEIRKAGGTAMADGADVSNFTQVKAMVERATREWGSVDLLCANAGILRDKSFAKMEVADFAKVLDVHLVGTFYCCKAVWDGMRERNYGRIVLTTSSSGLYGNFGQANYGAAKAGIVGLMNVLAEEGRKNNVRVNTISPTAATRMTEELLPPPALSLMRPEAITPAVEFMLSEDAPTRTIMGAGRRFLCGDQASWRPKASTCRSPTGPRRDRRPFQRDRRHVDREGAGKRVPADAKIYRSGRGTRRDKALTMAVAVIGAGPAGLMAAEVLARGGAEVTVYDVMPSAGRKFLMAGRGGLNLTHSEPLPQFLARYREAMPRLKSVIEAFSPNTLREWSEALGQPTFVGSSGRVFPKAFKASPLLRAWLRRLDAAGVQFAFRHRWTGWDERRRLLFQTPDGQRAVDSSSDCARTGRCKLAAAWLRWRMDANARGEERNDLAAQAFEFRLHRRLVRYLSRPVRGATAEGRCACVRVACRPRRGDHHPRRHRRRRGLRAVG